MCKLVCLHLMFICSADRDHRPAVKVARLLIKSYRLLFILLDSEEYILSTFKSVRTKCSVPNSIFLSIQKRSLKPKTQLGVANGIRKIQGLGNFCSNLEISEAF